MITNNTQGTLKTFSTTTSSGRLFVLSYGGTPSYVEVPVETISEEIPSKRLGRDPAPFLLGNTSISPVPHKPTGSYKRREDSVPVPVGCPEPILPTGKLGSISYPKSTARINANVQPILSGVKGAIFQKKGYVFGANKIASDLSCGKVIKKVVCSADESHKPYYKHSRCNDPLCPVCYTKFTHRIANAVIERVEGYHSVYPGDPISHLVFWPDALTGYSNMTEAFKDASFMLKKMGVKAAVVWYHPYRIKTDIQDLLREYRRENGIGSTVGFWELAHHDVLGLGCLDAYIVEGPHFHALATGYLMDVRQYSKLNIGGYKKVWKVGPCSWEKMESDITRTALYISSHACWEATKSTVRYIGKISYAKLAKVKTGERIDEISCEQCGEHLIEYYFSDDLNSTTDLSKERVTRKVILYKYFKRGEGQAVLKVGDCRAVCDG